MNLKNLTNNNSPFGRAICFIADMVILNLLWLFCSIPIITIGSSSTALFYALSARSRGEEQMMRTFFKGFKQNFKQSLLIWILALFIGLMLLININILDSWADVRNVALMIFALPCLLYFMILSYAFPLLAEFETTIPKLLTNSVLLGLANFPRSLVMVVLLLLPVIIVFIFPSWLICVLFIWFPMGFALCAYFNHRLLIPVFAPFRPEEEEPSE